MRIGLLGLDACVWPLARAAVESHEHELVLACELPAESPLESGWLPPSIVHDDWEPLLVPGAVDAVVVAAASDEDRRADQLRKLVQAGLPLALSHPVHSSMLVCYELEMIREESGSAMLPLVPERWHPGFTGLFELLADEGPTAIGALEQVVMTRSLAGRSRGAVRAQFARDVELLRALCGELTRLAALGAGAGDARYANLGVQLSGPGGVLARWSVEAASPNPDGRMTLLASRGKATLWMPGGGEPWRLEVAGQAQRQFDWDRLAAGRDGLARLASVAAGLQPEPSWSDAARDVELAETIQRSLEKGKIVDLEPETYSEEATFKGTMASLGCALLLGALLLMVLGALAAQAHVPLAQYTPHAILAVLAMFLLAQTLRLVFPRPHNPPGELAPPDR